MQLTFTSCRIKPLQWHEFFSSVNKNKNEWHVSPFHQEGYSAPEHQATANLPTTLQWWDRAVYKFFFFFYLAFEKAFRIAWIFITLNRHWIYIFVLLPLKMKITISSLSSAVDLLCVVMSQPPTRKSVTVCVVCDWEFSLWKTKSFFRSGLFCLN